MARVAVISDLHVGSATGADKFGHTDDAFLRFLDHLEAGHDQVVLAGDIYECLRGRAPGWWRPAAELARAREAHPRLVERFAEPQYHPVFGNHDFPLAAEGVADRYVLEADGLRLIVVHGDRFDWVTTYLRPLSVALNWANGWLARFGLPDADASAFRLEAWVAGIRDDPASDRVQRLAIACARAAGADAVICGHTHVPAVSWHGDRLYANSGSCCEGKFEFLSLDTAERRFEFHDRWAQGATPFQTRMTGARTVTPVYTRDP